MAASNESRPARVAPVPVAAAPAAPGRASLASELERALVETYGPPDPGRDAAARRFFAPGRVNLMGAHLDYNGGPVMPMPVDRGTVVVARRTTTGRVRLLSTREAGRFDAEALPDGASGAWFDYPVGVLRQVRGAWPRGAGVDLAFGGDLPIGAGLSSSASICIATALVVDALFGAEDGREDRGADEAGDEAGDEAAARRVERALAAERDFVGVQCGIMDPYAVGFGRPGHLLWLECRSRRFEHVPLDPARYLVGVVDSGVRRELAAGEFNLRVEQCGAVRDALRERAPGLEWLCDAPRGDFDALEPALAREVAARGRHVFDELERTLAARRALEAGDAAAFGAAMTRSHASLRENFEVSTPELDALVDAATAVPGVLGSRLTGAGFGGCTVVLLERAARERLVEAVEERYRARFGRTPAIEFFAGGDGPHEFTARGAGSE